MTQKAKPAGVRRASVAIITGLNRAEVNPNDTTKQLPDLSRSNSLTDMAAINESYGRLQEGLHITGYTWERACSNLEWLSEGDNWKNCGKGFIDINDFLNSLRFDQFRTVAEQRKRIATRIKQLQPGASNRQIARTLSVDHRTPTHNQRAGVLR